ncbi:hypothetical protein [Salinigranum sp. GCM10025319]|uniref:hypothetical protein n=1 Tax=Salinigranum sp. GCM10025319 TaxID=3252687 RepID=UPI00361044E3
MYRRALLVSLAGLSGCTGLVPLGGGPEPGSTGGSGGSDGSGNGGESGDGEGTTGEGTATSDPGGTTTDSPPSAAELGRMDVDELLGRARDRIDRAIDAYAGEGNPLTAVSAASDSFDPVPVIEHLYRAQAAYEAADRQGIGTEREQTIKRLRRVNALLRSAIDVQVLLVDAHADLEAFVIAVEYVDSESVESIRDRITSRRRRANDGVSELSQSRYAQAVGAVDRLSRGGYDDKRRQFAAETEVIGRLIDASGKVIEGVTLLSRARAKRRSGSPYAAAELARDAGTAFQRGAAALDNVAATVPSDGRAFSDVAAALVTTAEARRRDAQELYEGIA